MNQFEQILALIASLQQQVVDAQAASAAEIEAIKAESLLKEQAKYDEGFAAGVLSMSSGGEKIYSQVELDAKLEEVKVPFLQKVAELEAKNLELAAKVEELELSIPVKIQEAVELKVAEVVADFEASQVDDAAFLAKYKK